MGKKSPIKTVRSFHTSNVGANEETKTLWIFGAGATRHLGNFPMSNDLFDQSVRLCTQHMREFADSNDLGYMCLKADVGHGRGRLPSIRQIRRFKTDSALALRYLHTWPHLPPAHDALAKLHPLWDDWQKLPGELSSIGIDLKPTELLAKYPEELIAEIRAVTAKSLVKDHGLFDLNSARRKLGDILEILGRIYFYTLSHFNEAARQLPDADNLYVQLVKSFVLEKNARVISFNYDTLLDEAVFRHFTRSWHYGGMTIAGINGYPVSKGTQGDLVIIKPHGSLHYLICPSCSRAHVYWNWTYRKTGLGSSASGNRRCVHCKKPQPGRKELLQSMVVSPLYDKKIIKKSHQAITGSFSWCDNVVAIGYSFPDQDTYFFDCIQSGIDKRNGRPMQIRIVSHTHDSAKRIKARLDKQLRKRGISARAVKVKAEKLSGFEEVSSGTENVPVAVKKKKK